MNPGGLVDPRARLAWLALLGVLVVVLENPLLLGLAALGALLGLLSHPAAAAWRWRVLGALLLLAWTTALSQGLFYAVQPRTALVQLGPLVIWREGVRHGLLQSFRFDLLLLAGVWTAVATPTDRLVAALRALRLPFGLVLMGATLVRFVPVVAGEWMQVREARARRGRPAWQRSPGAWLALELSLLRPLAARALRRARALAESLDTRGFHPTGARTEHGLGALSAWDTALLGLYGALTTAALGARLLYAAYGLELWYDPRLRGLYGFVRGWL